MIHLFHMFNSVREEGPKWWWSESRGSEMKDVVIYENCICRLRVYESAQSNSTVGRRGNSVGPFFSCWWEVVMVVYIGGRTWWQ